MFENKLHLNGHTFYPRILFSMKYYVNLILIQLFTVRFKAVYKDNEIYIKSLILLFIRFHIFD